MAVKHLVPLALLGPLLVLSSCAPQAETEEEPVPGPEAPVTEAAETAPPEPVPPPAVEDDLRMPDLLRLPGDDDLRSTNPTIPNPSGGGVISRPPTDPPPRPRPPATD